MRVSTHNAAVRNQRQSMDMPARPIYETLSSYDGEHHRRSVDGALSTTPTHALLVGDLRKFDVIRPSTGAAALRLSQTHSSHAIVLEGGSRGSATSGPSGRALRLQPGASPAGGDLHSGRRSPSAKPISGQSYSVQSTSAVEITAVSTSQALKAEGRRARALSALRRVFGCI